MKKAYSIKCCLACGEWRLEAPENVGLAVSMRHCGAREILPAIVLLDDAEVAEKREQG